MIANRGEIAARIIRTCRKMGIRTVAVYSEADAGAPYVKAADVAVALPGNAPSETYLNMAALLDGAKRAGADAVHPGYGFLAENADFARKCADAGLTFIGPRPEAIEAMGSKSAARALMQQHGVPVVPGLDGELAEGADLAAEAAKIGYPVLLKAVAGGGGKGMRIVESPEEMASAMEAAKREAENAFGDGRLLLEKYFSAVRHVEFQIFGDQQGNAIHLLERECSIQRRYQKIIEESPSPALDAELREKMGAVAVKAAQALKYDNAGTVEFILTDSDEFYFLEVNTRLQVEHPVTEMVTGLDLVEWQIRVARGEDLSLKQEEVRAQGYAVECRLYAEDAENGFLPDTGTVLDWQVPEVADLRVDSGVAAGSEVSVWYDPMLAKIVVHGADRGEALRKMRYVLKEMYVPGLTTNRAFLWALLTDENVQRGDYNTHFLKGNLPKVEEDTTARDRALMAVLVEDWGERRAHQTLLRGVPSGWRNSFFQPQIVEWEVDGESIEIKYKKEGDNWDVTIAGEAQPTTYRLRNVEAEGAALHLEIDGLRCKVLLAKAPDGAVWTQVQGH
ncbi:MAG: acetyl-CoA carboxylase biotin carboxylase subunit, partial [Bacteroidota bacterium]